MKFIFITLILFNPIHTYANKISSKCIAHRGNNKYYLENSIESIKSAVEMKADGVEMDIRHTKDGHAIILHDSTLKRVAKNKFRQSCPLEEKISDLNLIDIRSNCILKNGEDIPLLIEVINAVKSSKFDWFIELKDSPTKNTFEIIRSYIPNHNNKKIISFKRKALKQFNSFIKKSSSEKEFELFKLYRFYIFHLKDFHADVHFTPFNLNKILKKNPNIKKAVWTIDSSQKIEWAMQENLDYITTNDPELCLFIKNRMIQ